MILHCLYLFSLQIVALSILWIISRRFEKRNPIEAEQSTAAVITDWKLGSLRLFMKQLLSPVTAACSIMIVNAMGGGWIHLRSDGWWFLVSLLLLVLSMDFYGYVLHYAFHKIPVLWAMHSLHHSAEALTVITGARHFWLEDPLFSAIFPIMGVLFKVPPEITALVSFIYLTIGDGLVHLNFRVSF